MRPESEWSTGVVPNRGIAPYTVAIRSPRDPERRDRATSIGGFSCGVEKIRDLKRWKTWPIEAWGRAILRTLEASPEPLTFNALGVVIADKTADALLGTVAEEALWKLVEVGRVEHTMSAPVLFRLRGELGGTT